jgi:hypothetical protein
LDSIDILLQRFTQLTQSSHLDYTYLPTDFFTHVTIITIHYLHEYLLLTVAQPSQKLEKSGWDQRDADEKLEVARGVYDAYVKPVGVLVFGWVIREGIRMFDDLKKDPLKEEKNSNGETGIDGLEVENCEMGRVRRDLLAGLRLWSVWMETDVGQHCLKSLHLKEHSNFWKDVGTLYNGLLPKVHNEDKTFDVFIEDWYG